MWSISAVPMDVWHTNIWLALYNGSHIWLWRIRNTIWQLIFIACMLLFIIFLEVCLALSYFYSSVILTSPDFNALFWLSLFSCLFVCLHRVSVSIYAHLTRWCFRNHPMVAGAGWLLSFPSLLSSCVTDHRWRWESCIWNGWMLLEKAKARLLGLDH